MQKEDPVLINLHLVVLGAPGTGKSSLCDAIMGRPFRASTLPTIGLEIHRIQFEYNNLKINYILYDTSGDSQERQRFNVFKYIGEFQAADSSDSCDNTFLGAIICYSKADPSSIDSVDGLVKYSRGECRPMSPISLFGNKSDDSLNGQAGCKDLQKYSEQNDIAYFEGSAKTHTNVRNLLNQISAMVFKQCLLEGTVKVVGQDSKATKGLPLHQKQAPI